MLLTPQDVELFFKLHRALMHFVNQRLQAVPDRPATPDKFSSLSPEIRLKVRDAFLKHTDLLQAFVEENPRLKQLGARLTLDEQQRVVGVNLGERRITDADLVHLNGLHHLQADPPSRKILAR